MQCILMNFDDRVRIIPDQMKPVTIQVGEMKTVDIDPAYVDFIKRAMIKTNDPLVILEEATDHPKEIVELMDILRHIGDLDYHTLLTRSSTLIDPTNWSSLQPSVEEIRYRLRAVAARFAGSRAVPDTKAIQATAARIKSEQEAAAEAARIQDDVDPDELDEALRKQREAENNAKRDKQKAKEPTFNRTPATDKMDAALGISTGANVGELGKALAGEQPEEDDGFDEKQGRPERPTRKKGAKKAAKAKPGRTRPAAGKKSAPKAGAKKPITRIRS